MQLNNNIFEIIYNHNKNFIDKLLIDNQQTNKLLCNSKNKEDYLMRGICDLKKVVDQATIFPMDNIKEEKVYIGISAGNWKQRFYNNRHSFSNSLIKNQTALSRWFSSLNDRSLTPKIKWRFIKKSSTPGSFNSRYNLYLEEKISIIRYEFTS